MQPRFPFGNAAPTLSMVCYKSPHEPQPTCKIPLENARVVIEGMQDSNAGFIVSTPLPQAVVSMRLHISAANHCYVPFQGCVECSVDSLAVPGADHPGQWEGSQGRGHKEPHLQFLHH